MCLYPELIQNPKYKANKKNGYNPPLCKDDRVKYVPIGCGDCIECRKQKQREWQARLSEDVKLHNKGLFVTLTFSTESLIKLREYEKTFKDKETGRSFKLGLKNLEGYDQDNEIATVATRLFLERWRKKYKKSLRHWLVTELGQNNTEHIHLHGILWYEYDDKIKNKFELRDEITRIWNYGYIFPRHKYQVAENYISERTVNYIVKYISKKDFIHQTYKPIILTSSGIGHNYTTSFNAIRNKYAGTKTSETYTTKGGYRISLPIYWRNKIYNDNQREQLWLQRLDRMERWVCGECVSVKTSYKEYDELVQFHRGRSRRLGYGDGTKSFNRETYERQRRKIIQDTRAKKIQPPAEYSKGNGLYNLTINEDTSRLKGGSKLNYKWQS